MQKKFIETILIQHSWKSSKEAQTLNFQRLSPLLCSSTVKLEILLCVYVNVKPLNHFYFYMVTAIQERFSQQ